MLFVMVSGLVDWFDPRLIAIGPFATDSGTLLFPVTFLLGSILTEVYGFVSARKAIYYGVLFNLFFIAYGQLIIHLPGPANYGMNHIFAQLFSFNIRVIVASISTYFVSEILNAYLTSLMKKLFAYRYLLLRFLIATVISIAVDCLLFNSLAFYGVVSNQRLIQMMLLAWVIMVTINILGLPIAAMISRKLKRVES